MTVDSAGALCGESYPPVGEKLLDKDIGHWRDDIEPGYIKALKACKSVRDLVLTTARYKLVAGDANRVALSMTEADWLEFKAGLKQENSGIFAGEEWGEKYGFVLLPSVMFRVSVVAAECHVPWGCAWRRLRDEKIITMGRGGVARLQEKRSLPGDG